MMRFATWIRRPSSLPFRVLAIILFTAFCVEGVIMIALARLAPGLLSPAAGAIVDSLLLTLLLAPVLWLAIVRPLQQSSASRGQLLGRLFDAQEQERGRIAHDLHDELGQQLTAVLVLLRSIEQAEGRPEANQRARAAIEAAAAGLAEVRRIARGLRPTVLEDLGLIPAVERLCEEAQAAHGFAVNQHLELDPRERFAPQVEMCVFRVLQESLTNCARHARARSVSVRLARIAASVHLTVSDDGAGFDPPAYNGASFGLHGMRERVEQLDGRFEILSRPGRGTTIHIEVPATPPAP